MSTLVIAEKPSVGMAIAMAIGATNHEEGYICGNGYIVSWCVGHLVGLANATSYSESFAKWNIADLPIIPDRWLYEISADKEKQFAVLKKLMQDVRVTEIICATDAGREGELIFRLVYNMAECKKPFKRLWISSMESSAILDGFANLHNSSEFDKVYEAALCRSKADWLIGINATRLFSALYGKKLVVGRVQTPTLAMIVSRDNKIRSFKKEKYFNVHISADGFVADMEHISSEAEAKRIAAVCDKKQAAVSSVKSERKTESPPKLYDLTTLQREANRYFGFTAQHTLDLVQSLYEKQLLTYPRTDSQFITEDMQDTTKRVISVVCSTLPLFTELSVSPNIQRITDNSKVTDHHAIIPTVQLEKADISALPTTERKILELVSMRLLCAVADKHIYEDIKVTAICESCGFKTSGRTEVQKGWREIYEKFRAALKSAEKDNENELPEVNEGDILSAVTASVTEHYTTPPKPFTEDTLLSAMETAGKESFEEDTEKKGLGTPATRAAIIEKLVKSGFAERKGRSIVPTGDGIELAKILPESVTSPTMTTEWENALLQIERGDVGGNEFLKGIEAVTSELVNTYSSSAPSKAFSSDKEVIGICSRCGSEVVCGKGRYYCTNKECNFCLWEDCRFFKSKCKKLTKSIAAELLKNGKVHLKGCYSEKTGKTYDAVVLLDDSGGEYVNFKLEFKK